MWLDDDDDGKGWNGVYRHRHRYHITAIYMKHDTINNQPTKETRCNNNNNNNILQIHFYDDTPLFLRKIMSFFLDGWRKKERDRERKREREKERII